MKRETRVLCNWFAITLSYIGMFVMVVLAGKPIDAAQMCAVLSMYASLGGLHRGHLQARNQRVELAFLYSLRFTLLYWCLLISLAILGGDTMNHAIKNAFFLASMVGWVPWFLSYWWIVYWYDREHKDLSRIE